MLPSDFNEWEHLQSVITQVHNRIVREEFSDADDDDIATPRSSLKTACLLKDSDSILQTLIRYWLFYVDLRKAQDLQMPVYGIPVASFQESRKFKPQIQLYFQEDSSDLEPGYAPVTGEMSFRLMQESSESLSEANLRSYANKIKSSFASGSGFVWKKGKVMCSYSDWAKGYQLQILCTSKTEGRRVVEQALDIQGHAPDWSKFNTSENEDPTGAYPTIPASVSILGKQRKKPRARPRADVRFQYALCHIQGLPHPIVLIDRSGHFRTPLVEAA